MQKGQRLAAVRQALLGLPAKKGRYVELILVGQVMHRALPAVLIETLRRRTLGKFRHWKFAARVSRAGHGPSGQPLARHWPRGRGAYVILLAAAKAH